MASPDVVDAALRLGQVERAAVALERFVAWAPVSNTSLVHGTVTRCRAAMSPDPDEATELFERALIEHGHTTPAFDRARTQLAYGERLRRDRQRAQARIHLRSALATFEGLGAALWAERARAELRATGKPRASVTRARSTSSHRRSSASRVLSPTARAT